MQVMQVMQVMQIMNVMQVMQAVKLFSESISHWALFRFDQLQLLQVRQLHTRIAIYMLSKIYIWITMLASTMSPLQSVNKGSDTNSVCYIKPNHFTHVLFSQCSSVSQAMSNKTKSTNVPPCRLCILNDSINMFYVAIPNQIILHMCFSSHSN